MSCSVEVCRKRGTKHADAAHQKGAFQMDSTTGLASTEEDPGLLVQDAINIPCDSVTMIKLDAEVQR